jgi:regulator of sigma E protease
VVVHDTQNGMGAIKAGLQRGDKIIGVNNVQTPSYDLFKIELEKNKDKTVPLTYIRNGQEFTGNVEIDGGGKIGITLTPITDIYNTVTIDYSLLNSIPRGVQMGVEKLTSYVSQMKYVFTAEGAQSLGGFGALGSIFPETWDWLIFWNMTAFLSVILAFMNILPIPALDGGHVLFLLVEIITRRKPSEKFLEYAQMAGMIFLLALMLYANGNDIYRFFFK